MKFERVDNEKKLKEDSADIGGSCFISVKI